MKESGRLGFGEFQSKDHPLAGRWQARSIFIQAARKVEPKIDSSLLTLCPADKVPTLSREALFEWAHQFNLHEPWFIDRAERVLWTRYELLTETSTEWHRTWLEHAWLDADAAVRSFKPNSLPLWIKFDPWRWDVESREAFEEHAKSIFARRLERYCRDREEEATAQGLKRAPEKRQSDHFYWLARFQIKTESYPAIAQGLPVPRTADAIEKACKRLSKFIELTLRAS